MLFAPNTQNFLVLGQKSGESGAETDEMLPTAVIIQYWDTRIGSRSIKKLRQVSVGALIMSDSYSLPSQQ